MRRASVFVIVLTFLALVGATLAVPARSAGMVWVVTSVVTTPTAPVPSGEDDAQDAVVLDAIPQVSISTTSGPLLLSSAQGSVATALGQPDLHWQPLWKLLWPHPDGETVESESPFTSLGSSAVSYTISTGGDWTVDKQTWAIQLGLIFALGGLCALALRVWGARREAHRAEFVAPLAAR